MPTKDFEAPPTRAMIQAYLCAAVAMQAQQGHSEMSAAWRTHFCYQPVFCEYCKYTMNATDERAFTSISGIAAAKACVRASARRDQGVRRGRPAERRTPAAPFQACRRGRPAVACTIAYLCLQSQRFGIGSLLVRACILRGAVRPTCPHGRTTTVRIPCVWIDAGRLHEGWREVTRSRPRTGCIAPRCRQSPLLATKPFSRG